MVCIILATGTAVKPTTVTTAEIPAAIAANFPTAGPTALISTGKYF